MIVNHDLAQLAPSEAEAAFLEIMHDEVMHLMSPRSPVALVWQYVRAPDSTVPIGIELILEQGKVAATQQISRELAAEIVTEEPFVRQMALRLVQLWRRAAEVERDRRKAVVLSSITPQYLREVCDQGGHESSCCLFSLTWPMCDKARELAEKL